MKIVTGYTGTNHVSSDDDRHLYAGILGKKCYVLDNDNKLQYTELGNNRIQIATGDIVINGTLARVDEPETVIIPNGTVGMMRRDVIVARYTKVGIVENVELKVLQGDAVVTNPQLPPMYDYASGYSVLRGDNTVDMPLYEVVMNDVNITQIRPLFVNVRNVSANLDNIFDKIYPVGSIYMSVSPVNPSLLFGGTWEAYATGRTLIGVGSYTDGNGTTVNFTGNRTGGEYNHKLTVNEMPQHDHRYYSINELESNYINVVYEQTSLRKAIETISPRVQVTGTSANGGDVGHNNVMPYIACYMWKRTN